MQGSLPVLRGALLGLTEGIWTGRRAISAAGDVGLVVRFGGAAGSGVHSPSVLQELRTCSPDLQMWRSTSVHRCSRTPGRSCIPSRLKLLLPGETPDQKDQSEDGSIRDPSLGLD
ncbi:hypothetical protein AMECASPLE_026477 [Ameca splendens]|uniref:Uncharacterized protein n=1 Tax=Ameca splendens TaxID=208324 RepID=A0ABV0Z394_9TELE